MEKEKDELKFGVLSIDYERSNMNQNTISSKSTFNSTNKTNINSIKKNIGSMSTIDTNLSSSKKLQIYENHYRTSELRGFTDSYDIEMDFNINSSTNGSINITDGNQIKRTKMIFPRVIIPADWSLLLLISFGFGFSDGNSFYRFGVFSTVITGNIVFCINSIFIQDYNTFIFTLVLILFNSILGTLLSSKLYQYLKNRMKCFMIISSYSFIINMSLDILEYYNGSYQLQQAIEVFNAIANGALFNWCMKTGWNVALMTINFQRTVEAIFYLATDPPEDRDDLARLLGDMFMYFSLLISFCLGVACSFLYLQFISKFSSSPYCVLLIIENLFFVDKTIMKAVNKYVTSMTTNISVE